MRPGSRRENTSVFEPWLFSLTAGLGWGGGGGSDKTGGWEKNFWAPWLPHSASFSCSASEEASFSARHSSVASTRSRGLRKPLSAATSRVASSEPAPATTSIGSRRPSTLCSIASQG